MTVTLDKLVNGNRRFNLAKTNSTTKGLGTWFSFWAIAGLPAAGSNPPAFTAGSGYVPDNTTTGSLAQGNATSGNQKYLSAMNFSSSVTGTLIVYDRMWACSGLLTNTTSSQAITTPGTLTSGRDPNSGYDVEPWIEVYAVTGTTGATWTLTGTDSTGTTGRTWTYAHGAVAEGVGQMSPMTPGTAVGGCRVATSFICSVSSGTAGNVGITLVRRIAEYSVSAVPVGPVAMDAIALGNPQVFDGACIAFALNCGAATSGFWQGGLSIAEITP